MDPSGAARASIGPDRLLVPGGIPGERVRVRVVRSLPRGWLAEIVAILEPSPSRVTPRCRHAAECGGCSWQQIAYAEQLRLKTATVAALLQAALGERAPRVAPTLGMPVAEDGMPWGFRQKAAFVFGRGVGERGLVMGHFARGSHEIVPVEECPVHTPRANRIAFAMRDALGVAGIPGASIGTDGLARHVVVRSSLDEKEAVAMLVVTRDDASLRQPLSELLASPAKPDGLVLNLHDRPGPFLVGRESRRVAGPGHVKETRLGPSFLVSPASFFQTNVLAAEVMLGLVLRGLPATSGLRVLDLYSGSGLFALPLAQRGHRVTAVEESRKGTRDAELNRRSNDVPEERLRLVCAKVETALPWLARQRFDVAILDPPRAGAPPEVLRGVFTQLKPARVILVSCNPEALARELPVALDAGYQAQAVQPVDMFPHTSHVEAVVVLVRSAEPSLRRPLRARASSRKPRPRR